MTSMAMLHMHPTIATIETPKLRTLSGVDFQDIGFPYEEERRKMSHVLIRRRVLSLPHTNRQDVALHKWVAALD
jgi:hypothetical protein